MSGGWQGGEFVMQVQSYGHPPGWWITVEALRWIAVPSRRVC
jgi:hypothetical protein